MARAETMESVGEARGGGGGGGVPLPRHSTCRMELPHHLHAWPGLLTTTTTTISSAAAGASHHLHNHYHQLHRMQALYLPCPLPYLHLDRLEELQTQQSSPALSPLSTPPPSPPCSRREERGGGRAAPSAYSGQRTDADRAEQQETSNRRGPLPDLLPQNEHPSWASPRHRAPGGEAERQLEIRRVARQLRVIADEMNANMVHRAQAAPQWQDWQDVCRGLLNFITQTLSTLYRLT